MQEALNRYSRDRASLSASWLFMMMIGVFGGFFQFAAGLIEQLLGFLCVPAQFVLVRLLRFLDFFSRLEGIVLSLGVLRLPGGGQYLFRAVGKGSLQKTPDKPREQRLDALYYFS